MSDTQIDNAVIDAANVIVDTISGDAGDDVAQPRVDYDNWTFDGLTTIDQIKDHRQSLIEYNDARFSGARQNAQAAVDELNKSLSIAYDARNKIISECSAAKTNILTAANEAIAQLVKPMLSDGVLRSLGYERINPYATTRRTRSSGGGSISAIAAYDWLKANGHTSVNTAVSAGVIRNAFIAKGVLLADGYEVGKVLKGHSGIATNGETKSLCRYYAVVNDPRDIQFDEPPVNANTAGI